MRALKPVEVERYDVIDSNSAQRVRVVETRLLPPGADGMTVGRWVLLRNDLDDSGQRALLAHELVHVRQYAERGAPRFLARYLKAYTTGLVKHRSHRKAYLAIPDEVEARHETAAWVLRQRGRIHPPQ